MSRSSPATWHLAQPNLGYPYKESQSIAACSPRTRGARYLTGASRVLAALLAIPLGIAQAVNRNRPTDYGPLRSPSSFYSMPHRSSG